MKRLTQIRSLIVVALLTSAGFALAMTNDSKQKETLVLSTYWVEPFNDTHYQVVETEPANCGFGTQIACSVQTTETPDSEGLIPKAGAMVQSSRNP